MTKISTLTFPSFYAECAYRDGVRAQLSGNHAAVSSYIKHGSPEPIGYDWYNRGVQAAMLGLVSCGNS